MVDSQEYEANGQEEAVNGEGAMDSAQEHSSQPDNPDNVESMDAKNPEFKSLKEALEKKDAEYKELLERSQRLAAEFDNYRKRTQKEKERIFIDAAAEVVSKFLPVVDNLERALKAAETEEGQGLKEGVTLVFRQLSDILTKLDVKPIETVGKTFNPELHNAVMHVEDENAGHNEIVEEFQKGYIYKDEIVIRHSMVKVAN